MRGTLLPINKAMIRPILMSGVEKRLMFLNLLLCFPLLAATHFHLPWSVASVVLFCILHIVFRMISKSDPQLGALIKRSTRYNMKAYFPAHSHPMMLDIFKIKSVSRPK